MEIVIFLEEPSAKEFLERLLKRVVPDEIKVRCVNFEGKSDLDKRLGRHLRAWMNPLSKFVVIRDKDSGDCREIKKNLRQKCVEAGKNGVLIRIACHELESWYLGDLNAVEKAFDLSLTKIKNKKMFRNPDDLGNPAQILGEITRGKYQKIDGSRKLGEVFSVDGNCNQSRSFNVFIEGITKIVRDMKSISPGQ